VLFFDNHPAAKESWTREVWVYDYRTNVHHTPKKNPLTFEHLTDFIACFGPLDRHKRKATWNAEKNPESRWRKFTLADILALDRTSLDISWIRDTSFSNSGTLPDPAEDLEAGLESFRAVKDLIDIE
jgi:type I restriction enzyme M protein